MIFDTTILKQVIRCPNDAALEATWVRYERIASDTDLNQQNGTEVLVKCHVYHATQMDALRADLGADAAQYEPLILEVLADYTPPAPPSPVDVARKTILELEASSQMPSQRLYREAVIAVVEKEALSLGVTLPQLRAKNKGYAGLKSLEEQIQTLRELIRQQS